MQDDDLRSSRQWIFCLNFENKVSAADQFVDAFRKLAAVYIPADFKSSKQHQYLKQVNYYLCSYERIRTHCVHRNLKIQYFNGV